MNNNTTQILNDKYNDDFNTALNIYENEYSHEDLIEFLKSGSVAQKQAAALKLDKINSKKDAQILIANLTGCDGKIREAISFRLKEFIPQNPEFFLDTQNTLLEAIIDINGNICRNTITAISSLKKYSQFTTAFCEKLIEKTKISITKVKSFGIQDGKYKINKEVFKLYWYLETISEFLEFININILKKIIEETKEIKDYTIREKTAKILSKINDDEDLLKLKQELKNDQNYYVRRF